MTTNPPTTAAAWRDTVRRFGVQPAQADALIEAIDREIAEVVSISHFEGYMSRAADEELRAEARQPDIAALRDALERLTDAASVEEEDWSPQTHDELVAALNQGGRILAALPSSDPPVA